ncbi:tRNA (guanosine(46)-N7)-methyltransferase TrmB [Roseivirga pacifica]|uniref:tRNA (guanosine(46)-N7)-methyltransferase TrmB n=1 Tax=Roseivirga pacifica TaxID=1267423 RepID=UPI003BB206A9
MGRSKLKRFAENLERENILQDEKPNFDKLKGNWNKEHFKNDLPLIVELGCGKGEYSVGLAERFPQNNFIGVDVKGDRLWVGSTEAMEKGIDTVAFLRAQIQQIDTFFNENEVSEFWITFPDPRPKKRDVKRRLTSPRFLEMYKKLLKPEGIVNFKTDNTALFEYTLETLQERKDIKDLKFTFDLYNSDLQEYTFGIKTTFEKKYLEKGVEIKYMQFKFA